MKRKSSLVKFIILTAVTVIALVACFVQFDVAPGGEVHEYGVVSSIKLGLDLEGGVYAVYEADEANPGDTRMNGTVTQLTDLLTARGYTEATVVREGSNRIRVEVPDVDNPDEIFTIIGEPVDLEFVLSSDGTTDGETIFTGDVVTNAQAGILNGQYVVSLSLNSEGAQIFADITSAHTNEYIKIYRVRDGVREDQAISTAQINEAITGGQATISGDFTYEEAQALADQIMSGTFSVTLSLIESSVVDPTLGENALAAGLIGGAIAFVLIMIFMCLFYRMMGMVACICMLAYMALMFFLLATIPLVQLSLPGIAGIILSLGMMIDGNVIIYERIKEEYSNGKSVVAAYHAGFRKAANAIIDGNVTTIFAAVMLLIFGTGTVSGFGLTLLIGLVLSVFSSLVLTRWLLKWTIAIWGTDPKLYRLHRRAGFNEADEEQWVPQEKPRKIRRMKAAATAEGPTEVVSESTETPAPADEDDFDKLFGSIDDDHNGEGGNNDET
ncbi:MAG TPA: protein translocase subunit SecD [Firmicutes bacterium]|mgnify:FL=1|nr:protein translocase subunit SecD [Bacillota bacterium]